MDKATLKSVISGLVAGDKITVNFCSPAQNLSGDFVVVGTRKGRGKGGSKLAELKSATTGELTTIGTPTSNSLVNVVVAGVAYGYESESDVPAMFETNAGLASGYKETFRTLLNASPTNTATVRVGCSTVSDLDGTFTVVGARQLRGRGGQIVLETAEGPELWSYRHSGIIESFSVVSETK